LHTALNNLAYKEYTHFWIFFNGIFGLLKLIIRNIYDSKPTFTQLRSLQSTWFGCCYCSTENRKPRYTGSKVALISVSQSKRTLH
jgi:hypothetical protein